MSRRPSLTSRPRLRSRRFVLGLASAALLLLAACEPDGTTPPTTTTPPSTAPPMSTTTTSAPTTTASTTTTSASTTSTTRASTTTTTAPPSSPVPGNPNGTAVVPTEALAADTSHPTRVIGTGTSASCTSAAVVSAVAAGGVITFNCGPDPITIPMAATAKVVNNTGPEIVIDGGGKVTLSGVGQRRVLYMNTCDQAQVWTTPHCQNQDHPRLTIQNLAFVDGNSTGETVEGGGGGAVFVRGGRVKVVNSSFQRNRCDATGPDVGGAALRVLSQFDNLPVYITRSTFGGASGQGNTCSNGGAISSIGVSWVVLNSVMSFNTAIGNGANPARSGTPGGGSGGAIYMDGNQMALTVSGTIIEDNHANEGGGAIFYVSNVGQGTVRLDQGTRLARNPQDGFGTPGYPGLFVLRAPITVDGATIS